MSSTSAQDRRGDGARPLGAVAQHRVDLGRVGQQPLHLAADLAEGRHGEIGQHLLEERELAAGELREHLGQRLVGERGIDAEQVEGLRPFRLGRRVDRCPSGVQDLRSRQRVRDRSWPCGS